MEKISVDLGNQLLIVSITLITCLLEVSRSNLVALEHPADPGHQFPSIWKLKWILDLAYQYGLNFSLMDQCEYGHIARKATCILNNFIQAPKLLSKRCSHGRGAHITLEGKNEEGIFLTSFAQEYPAALCKTLAELFFPIFRGSPRSWNSHDILYQTKQLQTRIKVPQISTFWKDSKQWKLVFAGKFKDTEHQNVLEMRGILAAVRHLARSKTNWNCRHLIFTDSMVGLGAFGKGRSSSPTLLRLCRRFMLFRVVLGMRIYLRYIETSCNHADGPSRGAAVGVHP